MQHISTTPFGRRPVTAGLLAARALAQGDIDHAPGCDPVSKWQVLRDLALARTVFGVSDRDLTVLAALVSFHRDEEIQASGAIVFPSNVALSQRAHGMAESTLRRHIAALIAAGLILRHDSPNGKRYAIRNRGEGLDRAFGFDLSPLPRRAAEIAAAAQAASQTTERLRRLRESIVLRLRDCEKLVDYGRETLPGNWDALADAVILIKRALRRKAQAELLGDLDKSVSQLLDHITQLITTNETEKLHGNASDFGRHNQYSTQTIIDSEPCKESARAAAAGPDIPATVPPEPGLPLHLVLRACPEILAYAAHGLRDWRDLVTAADFVRGMIGISPDAWEEARFHMGPVTAAITVACILQSFDRISRPGGYLRALARKSAEGTFSPGPMVMALIKADNSRAA
ncbi:plasmid replication protein RepC [Pseudogemmobacter bohemicus]|uniref:plasmid replication protein RepC n=1 Tax=Pseudogemmobacter bohemicus TaxID=2250708 RepID=UPI000DD3BA99|nr:plasmid replication protein RepC [Pseudogemmobacter bohemicus]